MSDLMISIVIFVIILILIRTYYKQESFYIQSWRPQTFQDINSGAPLTMAYNDTIFDNNSCGFAPGLGYLL